MTKPGNVYRRFSFAVVLLAFAVSLAGCASGIGPRPAALPQSIESARTRADHEDLALRFVREAESLRAKADEHERMVDSYGRSAYAIAEANFVAHCASLARRYREAEAANLALARMHRELAAKALR